jgi:uncharacterized coiled-coil DUF342 family protein
MALLQSKLTAAVLGALLFLGVSSFLTIRNLPPPLPVHAAEETPKARLTGPSWDFFNPELDAVVAELRAEREAVARKDKQLQELALRVQAERAELSDATRNIKRLQAELDRDILRLKEDEAVNLKKLAKMYTAMEPAGAARILREIEDIVIVKVFTLMKEAETAQILDAFARQGEAETKRAAKISESLRVAIAAKPAAPKP